MEQLITMMVNGQDDLLGHVHRVSSVATELGRVLALDDHSLGHLKIVGLLHDVGKIHLDPEILFKPGPLVGPERTHVQRHPEFGFAMTIEQVERPVADAILFHHERYDGTGYPFGLRGSDIPLLARIVLVADAFDAITSERCYQPAMPVAHAVSEIKANAGSQFDPVVVEAFVSLVESRALPVAYRPDLGVAAS